MGKVLTDSNNNQPYALEFWLNMINNLELESGISLSTDLQSYLVFMLSRNMQNLNLGQEPLAIKLLETSNEKVSKHSFVKFRDLGDECLLLTGLFPNMGRNKPDLYYFIDLGKSAYTSCALASNSGSSELFMQLASNFTYLMDLLQNSNIEHIQDYYNKKTPLELYSMASRTNSIHAKKNFNNNNNYILSKCISSRLN